MVNIKKINERMSELKITKAQLIKNSGLTRVTIDKVLSGGNINVDTVEALAKGLGVSVGFFFDDDIDNRGQVQSGGSNNNQAGRDINCSMNQEEHDELIRLREEVKNLKERVADLNASLERERKMNDYLMNQK